MPFGFYNSPATWQSLIDKLLSPDLEPGVFLYVDDIVICTLTFDLHIMVLEKVMERMEAVCLTVNLEKCKFCRQELSYLGCVMDQNGLQKHYPSLHHSYSK